MSIYQTLILYYLRLEILQYLKQSKSTSNSYLWGLWKNTDLTILKESLAIQVYTALTIKGLHKANATAETLYLDFKASYEENFCTRYKMEAKSQKGITKKTSTTKQPDIKTEAEKSIHIFFEPHIDDDHFKTDLMDFITTYTKIIKDARTDKNTDPGELDTTMQRISVLITGIYNLLSEIKNKKDEVILIDCEINDDPLNRLRHVIAGYFVQNSYEEYNKKGILKKLYNKLTSDQVIKNGKQDILEEKLMECEHDLIGIDKSLDDYEIRRSERIIEWVKKILEANSLFLEKFKTRLAIPFSLGISGGPSINIGTDVGPHGGTVKTEFKQLLIDLEEHVDTLKSNNESPAHH